MALVSQIADQHTTRSAFKDYHDRIAPNTLRRQHADLALFAAYLANVGLVLTADDLMSQPDTWAGVSHGLVKGFVKWMVQEGYAIDTINVRLATVKAYCKLAAAAETIPATDYALIRLVEGYSHKEGRNVDQAREVTRKGDKKATAVSISKQQADQLKSQPGHSQGRRDALLMCLLLDHGLRCGEVAALTPDSISLTDGTLTFYREKVDKQQVHKLTADTLRAATCYFSVMPDRSPRLLAGSRKNGRLEGSMSDRAITDRVRVLGEVVGLAGLSAHDCRHYWATSAIKGGTDIKSLQDAGGWSSPAMPLRYAESGSIANKGVKLD